MKKQTFIFTLLAVVLVAGIVQAEEKTEQELSNTRFAYTDLRITTDPKTFLMGVTDDDTERLSGIIHSPEVLQSAAKDVLGTSDAYGKGQFFHSIVYIPSQIGGLQVIRVQVSIALKKEHKPAAKEFLETYIEKLRTALQKEYDFACELHRKKLSINMQRRDQAEMNLHNLLDAQSNLAGGKGSLDKESVRQRILEHERAIIENDMQHAMLRKRAEELVKQIEEAHRTTDEIAAIRAAILELTEKRDHLRTEYKNIDFERNQYAENDPGGSHVKIRELTSKLSDLEAKFNQAEREIDKLSKREGQLESQTAGDIQELNRHLRETNIRLEELEIQERILYGYSPGDISDSIEYEMLEVKIEAAKENLRRAIIEQDEASLEFELLQPPTVSYGEIIGSETVPDSD